MWAGNAHKCPPKTQTSGCGLRGMGTERELFCPTVTYEEATFAHGPGSSNVALAERLLDQQWVVHSRAPPPADPGTWGSSASLGGGKRCSSRHFGQFIFAHISLERFLPSAFSVQYILLKTTPWGLAFYKPLWVFRICRILSIAIAMTAVSGSSSPATFIHGANNRCVLFLCRVIRAYKALLMEFVVCRS